MSISNEILPSVPQITTECGFGPTRPSGRVPPPPLSGPRTPRSPAPSPPHAHGRRFPGWGAAATASPTGAEFHGSTGASPRSPQSQIIPSGKDAPGPVNITELCSQRGSFSEENEGRGKRSRIAGSERRSPEPPSTALGPTFLWMELFCCASGRRQPRCLQLQETRTRPQPLSPHRLGDPSRATSLGETFSRFAYGAKLRSDRETHSRQTFLWKGKFLIGFTSALHGAPYRRAGNQGSYRLSHWGHRMRHPHAGITL